MDLLQAGNFKKAASAESDLRENVEKQLHTLKMDNVKLKETIKELKQHTMTNVLARGAKLPGGDANEDDLIDHFQNFDLDELG